MICGSFFEYAGTPDFEELLDWQVDEARTTELGRQLKQNRDGYKKQLSDLALQVAAGVMRKSEADRCGLGYVKNAVRRAARFIENDAWNAGYDWARVKYRNKRDGKGFDIPKVNVEERISEIGKQQNEKLREIVLG